MRGSTEALSVGPEGSDDELHALHANEVVTTSTVRMNVMEASSSLRNARKRGSPSWLP